MAPGLDLSLGWLVVSVVDVSQHRSLCSNKAFSSVATPRPSLHPSPFVNLEKCKGSKAPKSFLRQRLWLTALQTDLEVGSERGRGPGHCLPVGPLAMQKRASASGCFTDGQRTTTLISTPGVTPRSVL